MPRAFRDEISPIWVGKWVAIELNLEGQGRGFEIIKETGLAFPDTETAG